MNRRITFRRKYQIIVTAWILLCACLSPVCPAQEKTRAVAAVFIPYRRGAVWGYCDANKKILIEPRFSNAEGFSEGLAAVELGGKWGFIDQAGKDVIPPQYDEAQAFSAGLAQVKRNGKVGLIDRRGKEVVPPPIRPRRGVFRQPRPRRPERQSRLY